MHSLQLKLNQWAILKTGSPLEQQTDRRSFPWSLFFYTVTPMSLQQQDEASKTSSSYLLDRELVVGTFTKLAAPRSHLINWYKKCHKIRLLCICPLQQVINNYLQVTNSHLHLIGCLRGTTIHNLYPL